MSGKRYQPENIVSKLREAEALAAEGVSVGEVVRRLGVTRGNLSQVAEGIGRDEIRPDEAAESSRT